MITTLDNYMDVTNTSKEDEEHVKKKESEAKVITLLIGFKSFIDNSFSFQ